MLCGWHTLSDIPLTNVPTLLHGNEKIDIHIQFATGTSPIAKYAGRFVLEHSAECSRIGVQGVADFEISEGRQIRIWPAARAIQKDIEMILFGPVLGYPVSSAGAVTLACQRDCERRGHYSVCWAFRSRQIDDSGIAELVGI